MENNENITNSDEASTSGRGHSALKVAENSAQHGAPVPTAVNHAEQSLAGFIDEAAVREFILHQLHPGPLPTCPECGAALDDETTQRNFWGGRRCTCKSCRRWFSATTGTYLQGTQMSFAQVFLLCNLIELSTVEITPGRIAEAVGVSVDTVRIWKSRLKAMA